MRPRSLTTLSETITDHLRSKDESLRTIAADILSQSKCVMAFKMLKAALKHKNRYVRIRAAWGLVILKQSPLVLPFLGRAIRGKDRALAKQAAWALGRIRRAKARQVLVAALEHRLRFVREQAAAGLWQHALSGYTSKKVKRLLTGMLAGDLGHVTLTLRHMQSSRKVPLLRQRQATFFARTGGDFIR